MKARILMILAALLALAAAVSNAQTTYTLGAGWCSPHEVNCHAVPLMLNGTQVDTVWIDLQGWQYPTSSRFMTGIPELLANNAFAEVNLDSTYQVTTTIATFTGANGRTYTGSVPSSITFTWTEADVNPYYPYTISTPPNPITGTATVALGGYYYVYTCSGRGCGGVLGWHWQTTGGTITVNPPMAPMADSPLAPLACSPDTPPGQCPNDPNDPMRPIPNPN